MAERTLDQQLTDLVADGRIETEDAEIAHEFAEFLADPEVGPPGTPLPTHVLRRYADLLGITQEQITAARGGVR